MTNQVVHSIFVTFFLFTTAATECQESYMTFCDCATDFQNYKCRNWTDVVIKSELDLTCSSTITSKNFENLEEIKLLFVVNRTDYIDKMAFQTIGQTLKILKFYGNNLKTIKTGIFSGFRKLSRLGLTNNNIGSIEPLAFDGSVIKNLDLSRNQLEMIPEQAFDGGKITTINIRYNKLTYINENAFAEDLEVLNLDHNNLEHLQAKFARNSPKLRELSISHNKISHISEISPLQKLHKLDFSFNNINFINLPELEDFKELISLDLSSNKLQTINLNYFKKVKTERLTLLLSYNRLTNLQIKDNLKPMTLTLFGNPWNCNCLEQIQKNMNYFNFSTTKCDSQLFKSGILPICLDQGNCKTVPVENQDDLRRFANVVDEKREELSCDVFHEVGSKYVISVRAQ